VLEIDDEQAAIERVILGGVRRDLLASDSPESEMPTAVVPWS
jgi:hypothetical protein